MLSLRGSVRQSTFDRCEIAVRVHIKPVLGRLKLKKLTPTHVAGFYQDKLAAGFASASVNKLHVVLHKALDQAVKWHIIPRNVAEVVKAPRPSPEEIQPLSSEQAKALLEVAQADRFEALYVLAVTTGLRQGELLGLKWEDVDLEEGVVRVRRTLTRHKTRLLLGESKTKRGRRTVRISETAVEAEALKKHLAHQMGEKKHLGELYTDQGLVFSTQRGTLVNPTNLRKRSFKPLLKKAGLPAIRFHDLRHTCATLLLSKNVNPKIVSEMLGHANISITLDTYSHVLPNMQESAARALEETLQ
jgi:integrase